MNQIRHQDPSAEFASTEVAEVSRFLARPGDFTYAVTEVTEEGEVRRTGMAEMRWGPLGFFFFIR